MATMTSEYMYAIKATRMVAFLATHVWGVMSP